jgi:enoyl-CoA hydratase/carnithine racemase
MSSPSAISVEYLGRVAVITISNEKKLNALDMWQYYELAQKLREVATHDEVYVTVLTGKGRYFSAYVFLCFPFPCCPGKKGRRSRRSSDGMVR